MRHPNQDPKPLQHPCPETVVNGTAKQRWGFSGKPLEQSDVDALTKKGVDWERDIMPDGRLKHPKFRLRRNQNREAALTKEYPSSSPEFLQSLWDEYQKLPEDGRPEYFEWAAVRTRKEQFDTLWRIACKSKRDSERTRALMTLLEFSKTKPKQTIENINAQPVAATPEQILEVFKTVFLPGVQDADRAIAELLNQVPKQ